MSEQKNNNNADKLPKADSVRLSAGLGGCELPMHLCGLYLEHNTHKNVYQTAKDWLEEQSETHEEEFYEWKSEEQKQRALDTNEVWTLQWYPSTPIGFLAVAAPTLKELLAWANECEQSA